MDLADFFPSYPDNHKIPNDINPYHPNQSFNDVFYHKKEFYENRLDENLESLGKGELFKYQKTIARFLSSHTLNDRLLVIHEMGTGKTCSAIATIELLKQEKNGIIRALIIAPNERHIKNFIDEAVYKCTSGYYIPQRKPGEDVLTAEQKSRREKAILKDFYSFTTINTFAKKISKMSDERIKQNYSNYLIIVDEAHNLRVQKDKRETSFVYNEFHRFFHLVNNSKILLLTGTPMKDSPYEIASIMNLILPEKDQLPDTKEFISKYMNSKNEVIPSKIKELKDKFKGRVSFLKAGVSNVKKTYVGEKNVGTLKHYIVNPVIMSNFQTEHYKKALKKDLEGQEGVYNNSREATLFVYPNGTFGSEGYKKYIEIKKPQLKLVKTQSLARKYFLTQEFKEILKKEDEKETLKNIRKYSAIYYDTISKILENKNKKCCFVYCSIVEGSGAILLSLLLSLFGYKNANNIQNPTEKDKRFIILTSETTTPDKTKKLLKRFNQPKNMFGEYIQVVIGSRTIAEGISLQSIQLEIITTPHYNYAEIQQAIARGIRINSHNYLIKNNIVPEVQIVQEVAIPDDNSRSIDLYKYELSEDKDKAINSILRLIMESAFDCALNYLRNKATKYAKDYSPECNYTICKYKCDGVDTKQINNVLEDDLEYNTYNLYYIDQKLSDIYSNVFKLFKNFGVNMNFRTIVEHLKDKFTEDEIAVALSKLDDTRGNYSYNDFLNYYSKSVVSKIIIELEKYFKSNFYISLQNLQTLFPKNSLFELLTALRTIINNSIKIYNKYGIVCYLQEENNYYFLVSRLNIHNKFADVYYTQNITSQRKIELSKLIENFEKSEIPKLIEKIGNIPLKNIKNVKNILTILPKNTQEEFIEASILGKINNQGNQDLVKHIYEYYISYIKKDKNNYYSTFLKDQNIIRIYSLTDKTWTTETIEYMSVIRDIEQKEKEKLRQKNTTGLIGKFNPQNKAFCLTDIKVELDAKEKLKGKKVGNKKDDDMRANYTGRNCSSWKILDLVDIAVFRLKLPVSLFHHINRISSQDLKQMILQDTKLYEFYKNKIDKLSLEELRRLAYWGLSSRQGGNRSNAELCNKIQEWFKTNNFLENDELCGVQGKRQKDVITEENKIMFVDSFIPNQDNDKFLEYAPRLRKFQESCVLSLRDNKDNTFVVVSTGENIISFSIIEKVSSSLNNEKMDMFVKLCFKLYKTTNFPKKALKNMVATTGVKYLRVMNYDKTLEYTNSRDLIEFYVSLGFTEVLTEKDYTILRYE